MALILNPGLKVQEFDGVRGQPTRILCEVPAGAGNSYNRYLISSELTELLNTFDGHQSTEAVVDAFVDRRAVNNNSRRHLLGLVEHRLMPMGLLVDAGRPYVARPPRKDRSSYLTYKVRLISPSAVSSITKILSWLFHWQVILSLLPLFIAAHILFYGRLVATFPLRINSITGFQFLELVVITTAFGFVHEFGHASALSSCGSQNASVGWGVYIVWSVLYTDLSDAWRLPRAKRAIVDIGGIYFHCISLLFVLGMLVATHHIIWSYVFLSIDLQIAGSLNPLLRADGYWLVSDFFGVPDLRGHSLGILERCAYKLLRLKRAPQFSLAPLPVVASRLLILYTLAAVMFTVYTSKIVLLQLIFDVLPAYPHLIHSFWSALSKGDGVLAVMNIGIAILWKGLSLVALILFLIKIVRWIGKYFHKGSRFETSVGTIG